MMMGALKNPNFPIDINKQGNFPTENIVKPPIPNTNPT